MEEHDDSKTDDSEDMASDIVDSVLDDSEADDDGLSSRERSVEELKEADRIAKAKQLRKQLRLRELGILRYRWPSAILIIAGIISIWTEFLPVLNQPDAIYQFNTFYEAFLLDPNVFWIFPIIAGVIYIVLGIFAYFDSRAPWLAVFPAMMIVMAGAFVYMIVSIAYYADPTTTVSATQTPISMIIMGLVGLAAIFMREKE
ncbi:MAG: conserved membrane protein of unknown function [Candidatus Thorarchaeota archaeon]|nr:MAG: conserved membrane protein of unknown function [Candidatus Thorarchaeota archaeon]